MTFLDYDYHLVTNILLAESYILGYNLDTKYLGLSASLLAGRMQNFKTSEEEKKRNNSVNSGHCILPATPKVH